MGFYASDLDLAKEEMRRKVVSSAQFSINNVAFQKGKHEALSDLIAGQFYCRINCLNQFSLFCACFWLFSA